jgi:ABC-type glycerol-3-phosphate transport system substrate-binding protein
VVRFHVPFSDDLSVYRDLAEQFHELHPEIDVRVEPSSNWAIADLAAEADCFLGYVSGVEASRDSLLAIDPLLAEEQDQSPGVFYAEYLAPLTVDGTLWGLPLDTDARLLYYSRDRFDQAGEPYPSPDWTPRDFVARALDLAGLDGPEPQYGFYPVFGAYTDAATYVAWLGGQLFDAQGQPTFAEPSVIQATTLYAALVSGAAPLETLQQTGDRLSGVTVTWGERPGLVQSGQVAMWVDEVQHDSVARPIEFPFGVAPLPAGDVSFPATLRALYISVNAIDPDACWQWIAFLSAQPQAVRLLPVRRDVAASDTWRERVGQETAEAWTEILAHPQASQPSWSTDPVPYRALYWFDEALAQVLAGASPDSALADAEDKAAAFVACMQAHAEDEQAWRACARQADPDLAVAE